MVSAHVRSPISQFHPDIRNFITWFINPRLGESIGTGNLYHLGPYPLDPETDEWCFACAHNSHDLQRLDSDAMLARMRKVLQIPELPVDLLSISNWYVNALCAYRYRSEGGRAFLVGDAAHRVPPWGALGLHTGIRNAHNLAWKLGLMIKTSNPDRSSTLLDSYDTERRPIGRRVRDTRLRN